MNFLANYGLFLLQTITIVIAIAAMLILILAIVGRGKVKAKERLEINKLNDKYRQIKIELEETILTKKQFKKLSKHRKTADKQQAKTSRKRIFVLDFQGDIKASAATNLREEVTAILSIAKPEDEVLVCLESGGGVVHGYGLAASQLQRLRDHQIPLTVAVDKIAASGGYMMACVADKILAAPFAIIGSIGVVMQLPNFNKWLKKHNIEYEQITSGEYKRTLTLFGENTDKDRKKVQQDLDDTHELFKEFVTQHRPTVNMKEVSTGEYWFGRQAKELNLVDQLQTSDEYLMQASKDCDLYQIKYVIKKPLGKKFAQAASEGISELTGIV